MKYDGFLPKRLRSVSILDSLFWTFLILGSALVFLTDVPVFKRLAGWLVVIGIFGLLGAAAARLTNYLASKPPASGVAAMTRTDIVSRMFGNRVRSGSTILAAMIVAIAIISPSFQETVPQLIKPLTDSFKMGLRER